MSNTAGSACKPSNLDRWYAVAEQWYKRRHDTNSVDRAVWSELTDEAWDKLYSNISEEPPSSDTKCHKAVIEWSGPMFDTMDGGDYHYGRDEYYSDSTEDIVHWCLATLLAMKLDGYQSAECEFYYEGDDDPITVYMKDLDIPWEVK